MAFPAVATDAVEDGADTGIGAARTFLKDAKNEDVTSDLRLLKEDERAVAGIERGLVVSIAT